MVKLVYFYINTKEDITLMKFFHTFIDTPALQNKLTDFLSQFGESGLIDALDLYSDLHQTYFIKTKDAFTKLKIQDIMYIEIHGHKMNIYTEYDQYQKYGTLSQELKHLSDYGFIKCSKNCIVSLYKIEKIYENEIHLKNGTILHMSRNYASALLIHFNQKIYSQIL